MSQDNQQEPEIFRLDDFKDLTGHDIEATQSQQASQPAKPRKAYKKSITQPASTSPIPGVPKVQQAKSTSYGRLIVWSLVLFGIYKGLGYFKKELSKWETKDEFASFVKGKNIVDLGSFSEHLKEFSFDVEESTNKIQSEYILIEPTGATNVRYFIEPGVSVAPSNNKKGKKKKETIGELTELFFVNNKDIPSAATRKWNKEVIMQHVNGDQEWKVKLSDVGVIEFCEVNVMPNTKDAFKDGSTSVVSLPKYWFDNAAIYRELKIEDVPVIDIQSYWTAVKDEIPDESQNKKASNEDEDGSSILDELTRVGYIIDPPSNIRSCPKKECDVVAVCSEMNDEVKILSMEGRWAFVETKDGEIGYLHVSQFSYDNPRLQD